VVILYSRSWRKKKENATYRPRKDETTIHDGRKKKEEAEGED